MSRAFVKESDRDVELPPVRGARREPYYVTPAGYAAMQAQLAQASGKDADDLRERIAKAVVIDPSSQKQSTIEFGARVTIELPDKSQQIYRIVGEDEADPLHGTISWTSPLAQAVWGKRAGSTAVWPRPAGAVRVRIVGVEYA